MDARAWLEDNRELTAPVLVIDLQGEASGPGEFLVREDVWNPMYEMAKDHVVLHDIRGLWMIPEDGFLVICFERTSSPGWHQQVFHSFPGPSGRGIEFRCAGQDWTARFTGTRFVQVSGAAFGATKNQLVMDTTERRIYSYEFNRTEVWLTTTESLRETDVSYHGNLTLHNLGPTRLVLSEELYRFFHDDPDTLRDATESERRHAANALGRPPKLN